MKRKYILYNYEEKVSNCDVCRFWYGEMTIDIVYYSTMRLDRVYLCSHHMSLHVFISCHNLFDSITEVTEVAEVAHCLGFGTCHHYCFTHILFARYKHVMCNARYEFIKQETKLRYYPRIIFENQTKKNYNIVSSILI